MPKSWTVLSPWLVLDDLAHKKQFEQVLEKLGFLSVPIASPTNAIGKEITNYMHSR